MSQGRRGLIDSDEPNSKRRRTGLQKEERNLQSDIGDPHSDAGIADKLPDGFFDDPKMEAAVKNSVYINPVDAEIVKFNKEIEQENQKAEKSVEEDLIEIQKERNLEEIDSQIQKWAKVEELQKKADEFKGIFLYYYNNRVALKHSIFASLYYDSKNNLYSPNNYFDKIFTRALATCCPHND